MKLPNEVHRDDNTCSLSLVGCSTVYMKGTPSHTGGYGKMEGKESLERFRVNGGRFKLSEGGSSWIPLTNERRRNHENED